MLKGHDTGVGLSIINISIHANSMWSQIENYIVSLFYLLSLFICWLIYLIEVNLIWYFWSLTIWLKWFEADLTEQNKYELWEAAALTFDITFVFRLVLSEIFQQLLVRMS